MFKRYFINRRKVRWIAIILFFYLHVVYILKYHLYFNWEKAAFNVSSSPLWKLISVCHTEKEFNAPLLLERIQQINEDQEIQNQDIFGPFPNDASSLVIVVQVHDRIHYLRHLIKSLGISSGINSTLLIFSHDYWDDDINDLIKSIQFANVLQIFYPFSIQTHKQSFPGDSPNDCPIGATVDEAKKMRCTNANWPDWQGHYRQAKYSQIKHHWWWKANRIFNDLRVTKNYNGLVLFLEEDHYLTDDFLSVLNLMSHGTPDDILEFDILSLGMYVKSKKPKHDYQRLGLAYWHTKLNMGMALDRKAWKKIESCCDAFCKFDDYNWDWSLLHVSISCLKTQLRVMFPLGNQ